MTYNENTIPQLDTQWSATVTDLAKVNAIDASPHWLIIGGFSDDGKGVLEVWKVPEEATSIAE